MHWNAEALFLTATPFGESSAVARIFTREQGVAAGLVKGGFSRQKKGLLQPGNRVQAQWSARLEHQLGHLSLEAERPIAALVLPHPAALLALQLSCHWLKDYLPEHHPYPHLYDATMEWLEALAAHPAAIADWLPYYALWEMTFLQEMGFALDLSACAATGETENLCFISPKSGRAVSAGAGEPYRDRLLPFPSLYREEESATPLADCLDALKVSGYFLEQWLLQPHGRIMPPIRLQLLEKLEGGMR